MGFENLLDSKRIQIKDLQVKPEERQPVSESRKQYHALLQSPLYDPERNKWIRYVDKELDSEDPGISAYVQLTGVLTESKFNSRSAYRHYEELKNSPLYISESNKWISYIDENGEIKDEVKTRDLLLGVLVEAEFDKESAKKQYEVLKAPHYYGDARLNYFDAENDQWNYQLTNEKRKHYKWTQDQLLGVLVEGLFDKKKAQEKYRKLTEDPKRTRYNQTAFYDTEAQQWNNHVNQVRFTVDQTRVTQDHLLGILAVGMFDSEEARGKYETLKKTELYDVDEQKWNWAMNKEQELIPHGHHAYDQLLGVLVENMLEEAEQLYEAPKEQLPEVRRF